MRSAAASLSILLFVGLSISTTASIRIVESDDSGTPLCPSGQTRLEQRNVITTPKPGALGGLPTEGVAAAEGLGTGKPAASPVRSTDGVSTAVQEIELTDGGGGR